MAIAKYFCIRSHSERAAGLDPPSETPYRWLHSGATRTPVYVAQRLNRGLIEDVDEKRADRFFADARLPSDERAELEDYKGSGYSRGHMAPAGDMPTPSAMAKSFSLANMVPQNIKHNSGAWAKIEQDTRLSRPAARSE